MIVNRKIARLKICNLTSYICIWNGEKYCHIFKNCIFNLRHKQWNALMLLENIFQMSSSRDRRCHDRMVVGFSYICNQCLSPLML
jgi:hypothetical protein